MSDELTKEQKAQQREEKRRKKGLLKSLEKEVKTIKKVLASEERKLKFQKRNQEDFDELLENNSFANVPLEEVQAQKEQLEQTVQQAEDNASSFQKEFSTTKKELRQVQQDIKAMNLANRKKYKKALSDIKKKMAKNGLESLDAMPEFESNPAWEESDEVQKEFDEEASAGDDLVQNGCSKIGSGGRNVLMIVDKLEDNLEALDFTKIFKGKLGLDELKNYNDFLSEVRNVSDIKDSNVALVDKQYFPATTKFDISRAELKPNNLDVIMAIKNKNAAIISELAAILKVKMRNVRHIKFRGNQEEGVIDARSVYKIPNNIDDHIFEKAFVKPNDRVIVTIAIDLSGSMDKDYTEGGRKLRELAVILDAALTKAMIKHEVVGYGAPADKEVAALGANESLYTRTQHRLETVTYRTFEGANGLGNIEVKCWDNADGETLRNLAYKLIRSRSKVRVIINISDGKPFLHGADAGILDNDLKKTVNWLDANKVKLYSMGFNDYPKNIYGPSYLKIDSYTQLPKFFREAK